MRLVVHQPVNGVQAGQTFEVDAADASRLITYGFASPVDPGPAEGTFGTSRHRPVPKDASLAAELRSKADLKN